MPPYPALQTQWHWSELFTHIPCLLQLPGHAPGALQLPSFLSTGDLRINFAGTYVGRGVGLAVGMPVQFAEGVTVGVEVGGKLGLKVGSLVGGEEGGRVKRLLLVGHNVG
jgi:hypothetical protein